MPIGSGQPNRLASRGYKTYYCVAEEKATPSSAMLVGAKQGACAFAHLSQAQADDYNHTLFVRL